MNTMELRIFGGRPSRKTLNLKNLQKNYSPEQNGKGNNKNQFKSHYSSEIISSRRSTSREESL